jgi:Uma2 family endonuclease
MEAKRTRQRWTYPEFARLPSEGSTRYEVIDGELVVTPAPALRHQEIVTHLVWLLYGFVREHQLGKVFGSPVDVLFADGDYVEPDIVFVQAGRSDVLTERGVEGPPDLVAEVLSPATAARDRGVKLERYGLYGVQEYWVVDPDQRTIEVWKPARDAHAPVVHQGADILRWTPFAGGPTLEIALPELFGSPSTG